jgi:cation diffusion facilitator family transporter
MPQVRAAVVSLAAGIGVLVFKFTAYLLTGSVAILSDAAESVVNVAAANIALISLVVAVRPPDSGHPYGHGKAEYLSSATEGWLILLAGVWIFFAAAQRFVSPLPLRNLDAGLLVLAVATLANYLTARFLLRVSRDARSVALEADAKHLLVDVITSLGVFAGLGLVRLTGIQRLDPAVGVLIGVHILSMGVGVIRRSVGVLMDTNLPPEEESKVRAILADHTEEIVSYHALRARQAGAVRFIDLHLVLHRTLSVGQAHTLCDHLEDHIRDELPGADITIHVEPCGPDCKRCAKILTARTS